MEIAATLAAGALMMALLWASAGLVNRLIDRSIDRNLPDPSWFEA